MARFDLSEEGILEPASIAGPWASRCCGYKRTSETRGALIWPEHWRPIDLISTNAVVEGASREDRSAVDDTYVPPPGNRT